MKDADRANVWTLTALGIALAPVTAAVTGLVVANRAGAPVQGLDEPAASPRPSVTAPPSSSEGRSAPAAARSTGSGTTRRTTSASARPTAPA
jgi:hypothetical protein